MKQTEPPPPNQLLMQILFGKFAARALTEVANLAAADYLVDGPLGIGELASETGANEDAVYRVMRALASIGVFKELDGRRFANNEVSDLLRSDNPKSMRAMAQWLNCGPAWSAWGRLDYSVKTGQPAFDEVHGAQVFDYFKKDHETAEVFHHAMTSFSGMTGQAVADAYDFSDTRKIVDVGGGHGGLLATIITKYPHVRGVVMDLPEVVKDAPAHLGELSEKIDTAPGSFFDGVPEGGDVYIMKHIIHDWDDEHCVKILTHCRNSMTDGGKVVVVETVVDDQPESSFSKLIDLEMLVMTTGGRERTEPEFAALFEEAGLKLSRIVPTESPVSVVEAMRA